MIWRTEKVKMRRMMMAMIMGRWKRLSITQMSVRAPSRAPTDASFPVLHSH
jgi:hypothetical protein